MPDSTPPESKPCTPLEEATDPGTSPQRLSELARWRGAVARAVAANPNAPPRILAWLAGRYLEDVLANPVLPLLLLEDPGFVLNLPEKALWELLRNPEARPEFLASLERHPDPEIRDAARLHSARRNGAVGSEPDGLTLSAVEKGSPGVAEAIRVGLAPDWLLLRAMESAGRVVREAAYQVVVAGENEGLRKHAALLQKAGARWQLRNVSKGDKDLAPEKLDQLAKGGPFARLIAARHPNTPPPTLLRLLGDPTTSAAARRAAFAHRQLPPEGLLQAAVNNEPRIRAVAARNGATPGAVLERLATDPEVTVRRAAAANRALPETACVVLGADPDPQVREHLATNASTPRKVLDQLAGDAVEDVRRRLARRSNCPLEILQRLVLDAEWMVRFAVVQNRAFPGDRERNMDRYVRPELFGKKNDMPETAKSSRPLTAEEEELFRRREVAGSHQSEPAALAALAGDPDLTVREHLAGNPNTPLELLSALGLDLEVSVRQRVSTNLKAPAETLRVLAADASEAVRFSTAQNANTPRDCLERILADAPPAIRARVVFNKNCPAEILDHLARTDESKEVRDALFNPHVEISRETLLWLFEHGGRTPSEWGRDERFPVDELWQVFEKLPNSWERAWILHSNEYHRRWNRRTGRVVQPPIPSEVLLRTLDFAEDQYGLHRHRMIVALAKYADVTPEVLRHCANLIEITQSKQRGRYGHHRRSRDAAPLAAIARAPKCPPDVLARIAQSELASARLAALGHPALPAEARAERRATLIAEGSRSSVAALRLCALSHPETPAVQLRERAWAGRWSERFAIAQNPACPRDVLAFLCEDADARVRAAAREKYRTRFPDGFLVAPASAQ